MKIVRIRNSQNQEVYASLENDTFKVLSDAPWLGGKTTGETLPYAAELLLAPVCPGKIVAVGLNYYDHIVEMKHEMPEDPVIFLKPSTTVIGPGAPIVRPPESSHVDHEAELAVIIGKRMRRATESNAMDGVFGYTCANDVTARDLQYKDKQWTRGKGFDTFAPLGPWIETEINASDVAVRAFVNNDQRQSARTSQWMHSLPKLLSYISGIMTLLPGDVILTGTPAGVGPIIEGDVVRIEVEGIGALENPVIDEGRP